MLPPSEGRSRWQWRWSIQQVPKQPNWHLFLQGSIEALIRQIVQRCTELSTGWTAGFRETARLGQAKAVPATAATWANSLFLTSALSDSDISSIEGYLAHKWGLEGGLPSGHSYKSSAPSFIAWSDAQSFTTPTTISPPVLGAQSVANLDTTSADMQVVLVDNGNDATTITFFYGDNDGGTTPASWDSNVSFSNAMEATIRKSITSLTSGQTYYFRTLAKNSSSTNNGEDWANSSTAFTTVTSSVREDTEAVRYSDLEGWWKLDGNLNDSSGNNRHGAPPLMTTSSLWLDAADTGSNSIQLGSGYVQTWKDKSGYGYDFTQSAGGSRPSPVANGLNGLQVLSFDGTHDHLISSTFVLQNAHSIYAVAKSDNNGYRRILNGNTDGHFLFGNGNGNNNFATLYGESNWNSTGIITNSPVKSVASTSILVVVSDGANVTPYHNGTAQNSMSSSMGGAITGVTIGKHATASSQYWDGHIAEIIIFNKNHSNSEREEVEGYLAQKWGLTGSLPSSHSSMSKFKDDSIKSSGKSLDLSNGVSAVVQTGGTEDVFDGGSAFSTSLWVKGWPSTAGEAIIGKDQFDPGAYGKLKAWLDATSPDYFSKDGGTNPPSAGENFFKWYDLSGNGHHANVRVGSPKWDATGFNSKPGVTLNGAGLVLDNSKIAFDAWSKLHVFVAFYQPGDSNFATLFGKSNYAGWMGNDKDMGWSVFTHRLDGGLNLWGIGAINSNASGNIYISNFNKALQGNDGGAPGMFTVEYTGNAAFKGRINGGSLERSSAAVANNFQSKPALDFTIGSHSNGGGANNMAVGEFIIFNDVLSAADRNKIEGYLAHKWNLTSTLPSGHAYKSSAPAFGGWAIERASTGSDNIALNMAGAGDEFSKTVPVNDNEWHHIVTTYGGAIRRFMSTGWKWPQPLKPGHSLHPLSNLPWESPTPMVAVLPVRG